MTDTGTILLVEDEPPVRDALTAQFKNKGWTVHPYSSAEEARLHLPSILNVLDIAVIDQGLPEETGLSLGDYIKKQSGGRVAVVLWTGDATQERAANITVDEFWLKGGQFGSVILPKAIQQLQLARRRREAADDNRRTDSLTSTSAGERTVTRDRTIKSTLDEIKRYIAPSLMPVLIVGQTGTGKEEIAKHIHLESGLPPKNYRAINCAAFTDTLLMTELFGHVKGSFTGADQNRLGLIMEAAGVRERLSNKTHREAVEAVLSELLEMSGRDTRKLVKDLLNRDSPNSCYDTVSAIAKKIEHIEKSTRSFSYRQWLEGCGNTLRENAETMTYEFPQLGQGTEGISGTIFLDEVGDLKPGAQAAVLRFLDGYGIKPVGYSGWPLKPKVRIIAATNRSTLFGFEPGPGEAAQGATASEAFRIDLLWRLAGWIIELPPLHRRNVEELIGGVQDYMGKFGEGAGKPEEIRGKRFTLTENAKVWLRKEIQPPQKSFSGQTALTSGNFRNLNWLIGRACWIAAIENGSGQEVKVDEKELNQAARMIVLLEQRGERAGAGPQVGDGLTTRPVSPSQEGATSPDSSADALQRVLDGFRGLAALSKSHPADYCQVPQEVQIDTQLVVALQRLFNSSGFSHLPKFDVWKRKPHSALGESMLLPETVVPRWHLLLALSAFTAGQGQDGHEYKLETICKILRVDRSVFKKWIPKVLKLFGITLKFNTFADKDPSGRTVKPIREVMSWLSGADSSEFIAFGRNRLSASL